MDGITSTGNITLTAGTLLATSNNIYFPGTWTSSGGIFTPGTGTVTFTGTSTTIAGTDVSENFYNLTLNKTAGQSLSCGGSIATLAIGNNYTQTTGNFSAPATVTVGTDFTLTSGTYTANSNLTVGGDMLLTAGTYTAAANPATISGSFTNNGATFSAGTSTFTLNGSGYNINGSSISTFYNLTLSGAYTMSTSTVVENTLNLGAKLTLNNATLTIGTTSTNGSITGYSSANYIFASDIGGFIGYLKRYVNSNTSYVCPIGDVDDYTPLTFTLNSNGGLANAYITTYNDIHAITGTSTNFGSYDRRFWSLTESGITSPNYDVSLVYADGDVFGTEANYLPVKYSGGTWYQPTGVSYGSFTEEGTSTSVTVGTNTLNWVGLSTFSLFGGAGDYVSPLPIELLYFSAELMDTDVLLSWKTASEKNNDFFTVEKTLDGENYEVIGILDGAGNSISPRTYDLYDFNIQQVINYYRLIQTDYDGNSTYSKLVSVDNRSTQNEKNIIGIYNLLGQEIDQYYKGLVIIVYSDGSSIKMIQE